jgi:hypothetical protein
MNKKARRSALRIGLQTTELMLSAPLVITHRLGRMRAAGAGISARDQREFQRMGAEKVAAFGESWNQMALQMLQANQQITQAWMAAWWLPARRPFARIAAQMQDSALRVIGGGLAPVHRRATANAKRLGRAKTR